MTWSYRHRKLLIVGVLVFFITGIFSFLLIKNLKIDSSKKETPTVLTASKEETEKEKLEEEKEEVYYQVDIKGQVQAPGIYTVKEGSRVIDVIRLAGDITGEADTSVLNLSKKVSDEMVIIVYSKEEVANFSTVKEEEKKEQELCVQKDEDSLRNDACITESEITAITDTKISINTATLEELMSLDGIGETKAKAIIEYREENGPFTSIDELLDVSGIGEGLFANIKENITI